MNFLNAVKNSLKCSVVPAARAGVLAVAGVAFLAPLTIGANVAQAAETFTVTYRCPEGKTFHFEDSAKAKLHFDTVRKLGCEAKQDNHSGHIDVSYRLADWKQITLPDHDALHRWEQWLKDAGFETQHTH